MKIAFDSHEIPNTGTVVVGVLEKRQLTASAQQLDDRIGGSLTRAIGSGRFTGKWGETLTLLAPAGSSISQVLAIGLGVPKDLSAVQAQKLGAQIYVALAANGPDCVFVMVDSLEGTPIEASAMAADIAFGAKLRSYRFDKYFTKERDEEKQNIERMTICCEDHALAEHRFDSMEKIARAVAFTRDLVSEPANVVHPEALADEVRKLEELGLKVSTLNEKEMKKLGMNALLGVGQGSHYESQLVILEWWGLGKPDAPGKPRKGKKDEKHIGKDSDWAPLAFVGKGVTFDTGGISIKPATNMEDMKWDMAGAAAVVGTMHALAGRKAKVNAVGVIGVVENMPSSTAQRPGDVVTSMSGQTIEVINTDAEGRLVLADALWYTQEHFKPRLLIDLATLTGAIIIALGNETAGLFANDDQLAERLIAAGTAVNEPLWRLPLGESYDKLIKSDIADMKNVGDRSAGSITAAQFLQRFVRDTPWAHLDIAGVAWSKKDRGVTPKGATGFGVRLLERFVADYYEKN